MKKGDRVYVLSGLEVQEYEVYEIDQEGKAWIRRYKGFGMRYDGYLSKCYATIEEAVAASKATREKAIKRCAREFQRLALNTNVKVTLMKKAKA